MMAGLFLLLSIAFLAVLKGLRKVAIGLLFATIALSFAVFYHLATDILKINW